MTYSITTHTTGSILQRKATELLLLCVSVCVCLNNLCDKCLLFVVVVVVLFFLLLFFFIFFGGGRGLSSFIFYFYDPAMLENKGRQKQSKITLFPTLHTKLAWL